MKQGEYSLKTQLSFEAAHRLYDVDTYAEECRNNIHGHSYKVTVVIGASQLNEANMVIDFKLLKKLLRETIETKYDHSCILKSTDPLCEPIKLNCKKVHVVDENPTAEWMAKTFCDEITQSLVTSQLWPKVTVRRIEVQETENNIAIYEVIE